MSVNSITYEEMMGEKPSLVSELAIAGVFGFVMSPLVGKPTQWYRQYNAFSGGFKNRWVQAAKGGILGTMGWQIEKDVGFSLFGWKGLNTPVKPISCVDAFKKAPWKMTGKVILGSGIGAAMVGIEAYMGYKEGGMWGGIKGGAKGLASMAAWEIGLTAFQSLTGLATPLAVVAGGIGLVYGGYKFVEASHEKYHGLRKTEFGTQPLDPYGLGMNIRQRSLAGLQKSFINTNLALGNEANILHQTMR